MLAALQEEYYNTNNNVSNYNINATKCGPITNIKTKEPVKYEFRVFVKNIADGELFVPKKRIHTDPTLSVSPYDMDDENFKNILETVDRLFDEKKLCVGLKKEYVRSILTDSKNSIFIFVKEEDIFDKNDIYGFAAIYFDKSYVHISLVCSNKDYTGAGSALMEKIHEVARRKPGIKYAYLESVETAKGFYKKKGYKKLRTKIAMGNTPMQRKLTHSNASKSAVTRKQTNNKDKPAGGKSAEPAGKPAGGAGAK